MKWYNLEEAERIKKVYANYSIQDFWNFWSDEKKSYMEIRTIAYKEAKQMGQALDIYYYWGGCFVSNYKELKNAIAYSRKYKIKIWFAANPRKWNYNKYGKKGLGGTEPFVKSIKFLFLDIDRAVKKTTATLKELENCDKASELIIGILKKYKWANSYCKIVSGNGVQLLIKLDHEITMPNAIYNEEFKSYDFTEEFNKHKRLIAESIGKQIIKFMTTKREGGSYCDQLGVEIDKTGFRIGQVAALPFTKNYKYGEFTWRGIVELKEGVNDGFSDYLMTFYEKIILYKEEAQAKKLFNKHKIYKSKVMENKLIKFMLENNLPYGMLNNYLWFSLKCLFRDSGFKTSDKEFIKVHKLLQAKYGTFTTNIPESRFEFNPDIVNKYCIINLIPPLYDLWDFKYCDENFKIDNIKWEDRWIANNKKTNLPPETDIMEDMKGIKLLLEHGSFGNVEKVYQFTNGCIDKYGVVKAKYYTTYLFKRYIGHK